MRKNSRITNKIPKPLKYFSVQSDLISSSFIAAWLIVPEDLRSAIPVSIMAVTAIVLILLGTVGRFIPQNYLREKDNEDSRNDP